MTFPFFTIGHSTRSLESFIELLKLSEIRIVADVRTIPRSRTNPQYNRDVLPGSLSAFQIGYTHMPALGGLRGRRAGCRRQSTLFGRTRAFTITLTTQ